jgi:hypothetical protein
MENSHVIISLVVLLVIAVTVSLIAFVVIPAFDDNRLTKKDKIRHFVDDINSANKSGYRHDMRQDRTIEYIKEKLDDMQHGSSSDLPSIENNTSANVSDEEYHWYVCKNNKCLHAGEASGTFDAGSGLMFSTPTPAPN